MKSETKIDIIIGIICIILLTTSIYVYSNNYNILYSLGFRTKEEIRSCNYTNSNTQMECLGFKGGVNIPNTTLICNEPIYKDKAIYCNIDNITRK